MKSSNLISKIIGVIIGLSIFSTVARFVSASSKIASVDMTQTPETDVIPEQVLAQRDGMSDSNSIQNYAQLLNQLEDRCIESRIYLASMAINLAEKEKISNLEGLETLLFDVDAGFEQYPAKCFDAYLYHVGAGS